MRNLMGWMFIMLSIAGYSQDWAQLSRYKTENERLGKPAPGENRIVLMGNSITEGWLEQYPEFFSGKPYVDRGISGQTTPQMLIRFRQDVIELQPKAVVILAGTNDIAENTGPTTLPEIAGNIFSMVELARVNGVEVLLCSVLPAADYPWRPGLKPAPKIAQLNQMLKDYAERHNLIWVDYYSAMSDEKGGLRSEYTYDGVHPNRKGYEVMSEILERALKNLVKKE
ncbi:MAG: SGNH/GDSL hydrolase family protein [Bacteroidales bacterium]